MDDPIYFSEQLKKTSLWFYYVKPSLSEAKRDRVELRERFVEQDSGNFSFSLFW